MWDKNIYTIFVSNAFFSLNSFQQLYLCLSFSYGPLAVAINLLWTFHTKTNSPLPQLSKFNDKTIWHIAVKAFQISHIHYYNRTLWMLILLFKPTAENEILYKAILFCGWHTIEHPCSSVDVNYSRGTVKYIHSLIFQLLVSIYNS